MLFVHFALCVFSVVLVYCVGVLFILRLFSLHWQVEIAGLTLSSAILLPLLFLVHGSTSLVITAWCLQLL